MKYACVVCNASCDPGAYWLCGPCRRSYDRANAADPTIAGVIRWAARRALRLAAPAALPPRVMTSEETFQIGAEAVAASVRSAASPAPEVGTVDPLPGAAPHFDGQGRLKHYCTRDYCPDLADGNAMVAAAPPPAEPPRVPSVRNVTRKNPCPRCEEDRLNVGAPNKRRAHALWCSAPSQPEATACPAPKEDP